MSRQTREYLRQNIHDLDKISEKYENTMRNKNISMEQDINDMKKHHQTRSTNRSTNISTNRPTHHSVSASHHKSPILSSDMSKNFNFY